jgi:hypothetical protein
LLLGRLTVGEKLKKRRSSDANKHLILLALPRGDEGQLQKALKNKQKSARPLLHCYHPLLLPATLRAAYAIALPPTFAVHSSYNVALAGKSSQVRLSRMRPVLFLLVPPHCLK